MEGKRNTWNVKERCHCTSLPFSMLLWYQIVPRSPLILNPINDDVILRTIHYLKRRISATLALTDNLKSTDSPAFTTWSTLARLSTHSNLIGTSSSKSFSTSWTLFPYIENLRSFLWRMNVNQVLESTLSPGTCTWNRPVSSKPSLRHLTEHW